MKQNYVDIPVPVAHPQLCDSVPGFEALQWAKQNCPSYITNDAVQKRGEYHYRFYFGQERDRLMFLLKWS